MTLVAALCTFALGEQASATHAWPPRSIGELMEHAGKGPKARIADLAPADLRELLAQGLEALDDATLPGAGLRFPQVDQAALARALFDLESGQLALSLSRAAVFIDSFLALAAEAYLCDPREANDASALGGGGH